MTGQINNMKKQVLCDAVLAGQPLLVVEYRATETDTINRKVVKAGESAVMPVVKHKVLVGNDSWEVTEFLPDGADLSKVKPPFTPRQLVVLKVEAMERTKFGNRISGEFQGALE